MDLNHGRKDLGVGVEPFLLTEAITQLSPSRPRHRPAFSNELLRHLSSTPSSSVKKHRSPSKQELPHPELVPFPLLHIHRGKSLFRASKYPQMCLSPELDKKMKLIAGYQSLLDLEIASDHRQYQTATSPEAKKRPKNTDSTELMKITRNLMALKHCSTCKKTYCACSKPVKDRYLVKMTRRFERLKSKIPLDSSDSSSKLKSVRSQSVFRTWGKLENQQVPIRILKTKDKEYKISFKANGSRTPTGKKREIINIEAGGKKRDSGLEAFGLGIRSASVSKIHGDV